MGNRTTRRDTWLRRVSSRIANGVRGRLLRDGTPDTGCGIKVFDRAVFLDMPRFNHMHRFMPALFRREGFEVVSVPVNHRERTRGRSKYGLHNRLWVESSTSLAWSGCCVVRRRGSGHRGPTRCRTGAAVPTLLDRLLRPGRSDASAVRVDLWWLIGLGCLLIGAGLGLRDPGRRMSRGSR